jgi:hypothetical protein
MELTNEVDILMDIYSELSSHINYIKTSKNTFIKINTNIQNLNNDYFLTNCSSTLFNEYINIFNNNESYNELIDNLETLKLFFKEKIQTTCHHCWVTDYIDIGQETSQQICYCNKCEITKR